MRSFHLCVCSRPKQSCLCCFFSQNSCGIVCYKTAGIVITPYENVINLQYQCLLLSTTIVSSYAVFCPKAVSNCQSYATRFCHFPAFVCKTFDGFVLSFCAFQELEYVKVTKREKLREASDAKKSLKREIERVKDDHSQRLIQLTDERDRLQKQVDNVQSSSPDVSKVSTGFLCVV